MGLATIDPHSQKEHTEIHIIPKFGVIRLVLTEIKYLKTPKLTKKCKAIRTLCSDSVHMGIHFILTFSMAVSCLLLSLFTPKLEIL